MKFTQPFDMSFTAKALALLFFLSTAIGAYCHHTSIPFWDMWNGYVEFGVRMLDGHWSSLWDQHNEHRITVSRLLFLIDLFAFKGNSRFLIIANVLLLAVSAWTFFSIARSDLGDNHNVALPYLLVAWMFSWCQSDNIVWAFQSQFILAQITPLWSLLLLNKSIQRGSHWAIFVAACISGAASSLTMANGVLTLPCMTIFLLLTRGIGTRTLILTALSVANATLYFHAYTKPDHTAIGPIEALLSGRSLEMLTYGLLYIGNPIWFIAKGILQSEAVGVIAGAILLLMLSMSFIRVIKQRAIQTLDVALATYCLYLLGTAAATTAGRFTFGLSQATSSRYATPALMLWACAFLLSWRAAGKRQRRLIEYGLLGMVVLALPGQFKVTNGSSHLDFERHQAVLAASLETGDSAVMQRIFPSDRDLVHISRMANERGLTVFGHGPFVGVFDSIGKPAPFDVHRTDTCKVIDYKVEPFLGNQGFARIDIIRTGFRDSSNQIDTIVFADEAGKVIGAGLSDKTHFWPVNRTETQANRNNGYILDTPKTGSIYAYWKRDGCVAKIAWQAPTFRIEKLSSGHDMVTEDNLVADNARGSDWHHSNLPGYIIHGSVVTSDLDTGKMEVRMRSGQGIALRTGPSMDHVRVSISGDINTHMRLAPVPEWAVLRFTEALGDTPALVTFEDAGTDHGQWIAVALKNSKPQQTQK
jgi:hypothetical protein